MLISVVFKFYFESGGSFSDDVFTAQIKYIMRNRIVLQFYFEFGRCYGVYFYF